MYVPCRSSVQNMGRSVTFASCLLIGLFRLSGGSITFYGGKVVQVEGEVSDSARSHDRMQNYVVE